jgi:hypothetical protein
MDHGKQPGNVIATLSVHAEAEVTRPGDAKVLESTDPMSPAPHFVGENDSERVHFEENK